jgi:hypothetical protein
VEQLGFFFQIFLFCCLNKLAKISKILAHLVDFTQGKVESFQEKSNFFVWKGQNLWDEKIKPLEAIKESAQPPQSGPNA